MRVAWWLTYPGFVLIYISLFSDTKRSSTNLLIFYIYFLYYELPDHILHSSINLYYYSKKKAKTKNFVSNVSNSILRYLSFHCLNFFIYTTVQIYRLLCTLRFWGWGAVEKFMFRKTFLHPRLYLLSHIFFYLIIYLEFKVWYMVISFQILNKLSQPHLLKNPTLKKSHFYYFWGFYYETVNMFLMHLS